MTTGETASGPPIRDGITVGAAVWVVSAVLLFFLAAGLGGGSVGPLRSVVAFMLLFNLGGLVFAGGFLLAGAGPVFFAIPFVGSLVGGYVLADDAGTNGVTAGASVAAGFLLCQTLAAFVVLSIGGGSAPFLFDSGPLFLGIGLGGGIQPAVVGAIGGAIAEY